MSKIYMENSENNLTLTKDEEAGIKRVKSQVILCLMFLLKAKLNDYFLITY